MTAETILPCPFCGSEAKLYASGVAPTLVDVCCENIDECGAQITGENGVKAVIAAWNRRAGEVKP